MRRVHTTPRVGTAPLRNAVATDSTSRSVRNSRKSSDAFQTSGNVSRPSAHARWNRGIHLGKVHLRIGAKSARWPRRKAKCGIGLVGLAGRDRIVEELFHRR